MCRLSHATKHGTAALLGNGSLPAQARHARNGFLACRPWVEGGAYQSRHDFWRPGELAAATADAYCSDLWGEEYARKRQRIRSTSAVVRRTLAAGVA